MMSDRERHTMVRELNEVANRFAMEDILNRKKNSEYAARCRIDAENFRALAKAVREQNYKKFEAIA